jgi:glycosyltransferase involved in cell wall biosynthesis
MDKVVPDLNSGGVERGTVDVANYLAKKGYTNFVCSNGGALTKELSSKKIKHITLPVHSKNILTMITNIYRLHKVIKENTIDIVHVRSRAPAWSTFFACKTSGAHLVTTFHAAYSLTYPLKKFYNSIMLKGDKVIAISKFIKKHIENRYHFKSDHLVTIERGIDLSFYDLKAVDEERVEKAKTKFCTDFPKDTKIILVPARFTKIKGHGYLLHALKYLKGQNIRCIIVGKLNEKQYDYFLELEKFCEEHQLSQTVKMYTDAYPDMAALYSIADVVICPSLEPEGFGRIIVEAQAMKKIIIATNIGAPSYIIKDGSDGFLSPVNDAATFSEIIYKALSLSPADYAKIANAGRKKVEKYFTLETMCEKTLSVYKSLVEDK